MYLKNCTTLFPEIEVVAVADLIADRAAARRAEFGLPRACSVNELLSDTSIQAVLNLTVPRAHYEVMRAALETGKHAYGEKPLSTELKQGETLAAVAGKRGLALGSAPDTFLGAGLQTCRALIDEGAIGRPVGGTAFMVIGGHESWHPDPGFYYQKGGGPVFDMGPYYLTALISLLGPVAAVSAVARRGFEERVITSEPRRGTRIPVEVPTHVASLLDFASGASVVMVMSFDAPGGTSHNPIEIYGTEGTLLVPDPNTFGGPVRIRRPGSKEWTDVPLRFGYAENSRGLGLADMCRAVLGGGRHRASGILALHVLEVMHGMHVSSDSGKKHVIRHGCERPEPLRG
jgi:predicted dehydrogenase